MAAKKTPEKSECELYLTDIYDGKINACKRMMQLSETMLNRIRDGYRDWHFDYRYANKPCRFIESFCMLPSGKMNSPFKMEPFQKANIQLMFGFVDDKCMRQFHEVLWVQGRKNAKALSLDTPIPTPLGYKLMRDIHEGDTVFGANGKPVRVTAESEIFHKKMYAVTFEDGETIEASADHIWTVSRIECEYGPDYGKRITENKTTEELFAEPLADWEVQMNKPVEYETRELSKDPYRLGLELADDDDAKQRIPIGYLRGDIDQRRMLLRGIIDSNDNMGRLGYLFFNPENELLVDDVSELLSGLGIAHTCDFYSDGKRLVLWSKRKYKRITSVVKIAAEPSKCIAVDSQDHLFLCGKHYTATHNTTTGAALELFMLMADGEGAPQVYNAATSRPQASLAFGAAYKMMRQSKVLSKRLRKGKVVDRDEDGIINDANFGYICTLSSQTRRLDGLNVHFALFDELAACTNRDQYDLVKQGMSSRDQPMMLCITTNGFERGNIFDNRYDYGCGILDGEIDDDRFLPIIYELDKREEWTDESAWIKANPGLGPIKKESTLRDFVSEAEQNPSFLPTVLTKDFNIPENRAAAWLTFEESVNEETYDISKMGFRYGIAGFDASDTTDLSSATMMMMRPDDPKVYELKMSWLPEDSLRNDGLRTERDDVPYRLWEKQGWLRVVPGNKVPKQVFIDWLEEVKETYDVWCFALGYDPWHIIGTDETNLQQYVGKERAEVVRQGVKTLSDPMKQIRADFKNKRMVDNHNPLAEWARMNVSVKTDVNANIQPVKLGGKAKNRIDPFMSELFAYIALLRHLEEYQNVI